MTITRGRVLRGHFASSPSSSSPTLVAPSGIGSARRIAREVLEAHEEADRIRARAEEDARARLELAEREVEHLRAHAAEDARAASSAKLAAAFLVLRAEDERRAARDLERTVALAKVLAERLIGEELHVAPDQVTALAKSALREARGARRVTIEARPADAAILRARLDELSFVEAGIEIQERAELGPGSLVVHTDVGTLDARIDVQLDRLTDALSGALADALT